MTPFKLCIAQAKHARARREEDVIRELLGRWVSEIEPAIAYHDGEIIGICAADTPIGIKPFILAR